MNYKELMPKASSLQKPNDMKNEFINNTSPNKVRNLIATQNSLQMDSKRIHQATKILSDNNVNEIKEKNSPRDLLPDIA